MPAIDEVLMMTPRCPSPSAGSVRAMAAAAMRMRLKVPIRLTLMTRWYGARSCGVPSRPTVRAAQPMPAQLTATRSGIPVPAAASTAAWTEASSATSVRANTPPVSLATRLPPSSFRSAMTTVAPAAASARAVASPSPLAPPETIAAVPFTSMPRSIPAGRMSPLRAMVLTMRKLHGNPWAVLVVVSLGFFMTLLDLTIVNIAIPNMILKLHATLDDVLWVLNAYALVLAVLVITAGRLGDLRGPRTMFVAGIIVFTAASAACGFAPGPGWLIGFRAVQGLGAAMLMPQTLAIVTMVFPPERRGAAFGIWGAVAGLATIAGPTLGGLLVTAFDWRWIFFVNLPIGAAVLAVTFVIVPDLHPGRRHRLDLIGVGLASLGLLAICYGLVEGQNYDWGTITSFVSIPLILGFGVVMLGVFLLVQKLRQAGEPLVPFALFRNRNFTLMNWVSFTLSIGMLGIFLPFTIYLQDALGFSALKAGLAMAPSSLIMIFIAPFMGRLTDKVGGKYILMSGLTLFAIGMGWAVLIAGPSSGWQDFMAPLIVAGAGMGATFAPLTTTAMREVEPQLAGAASGVLNTVRQVGSVKIG